MPDNILFNAQVDAEGISLSPSDGDSRVGGLKVLGIVKKGFEILAVAYNNSKLQNELKSLKPNQLVVLGGTKRCGTYPQVVDLEKVISDDV